MSATDAQVRRLRRMVNEPTNETYKNEDLAEYVESYPAIDPRGERPFSWDTSTQPPTQDPNDDWVPTYDLNAAAADLWEEKAAVVAQDFQFQADGGSYSRQQKYEQYMKQARYFRARRKGGTITLRVEPEISSTDVFRPSNLDEIG